MTQDNNQLDEQLLSPDYFTDPYPAFRRLREEDPVHWCEPWNCWIVSRYTDVLAGLRQDGRQFSAVGRFGAFLDALPEAERPRFQPIKDHYSVGLLHSDPPDHTRLRGLVSKAFTPQIMDGMRPRIEAVIDELLDAAEAAGQFDLIGDFAFHLPAIVTAVAIGIPPEERHQFKVWSDDVAEYSASSRLTIEVAENALRSLLEARAYLLEIAARRRTDPRDDLISRLVATEDDELSQGELLSTCVTFLVGGHETTTALLASGLLTLFRNPDQLAALRDAPDAIATAVEEFLRYESPNQRIVRLAKEDIEIEGRSIKRGQQVMFLLASANRDSDQFPHPDRLDIHRSPNRHLAFAIGPHACFGMRLARLEAQIAFTALLSRFPNLRLTQPNPKWAPSYQLRMLKSLPVSC